MKTATKIACPHCGKINSSAHDDGAVDGPREYHADCWVIVSEKMSGDEVKDAWNNSPLPA